MTETPAALAHTCAEFLKTNAATHGLDVHVSTRPPIVAGPYTTEPFTCPHGTTYWIEPTGEWIAWAVENGVE
jgi:hypothetical protein